MNLFRAHWPIHDDTATLRDLATLALDDLAQLVDDTDHVITGEPTWTTTEDPTGQLHLTATVPVRPVTFGTYRKQRKAAS